MGNKKRNRDKRLVKIRERLRKERILNGEEGTDEDRARLQVEELEYYLRPLVYSDPVLYPAEKDELG